MRNHKIIVIIFLSMLFLLNCSSCWKSEETEYTASFEAFMEIVPEQYSQDEIRELFGKPENVRDEVSVICWDYYAHDDPEILMRIRFSKDTALVSKVTLYDSTRTVSDLLDQFGEPPVIFQADISEHGDGIFYRVFFAYPEQGIFAYVDNPMPSKSEPLASLYREISQPTEEYVAYVETNWIIRMFDWP